MNRSKTSSRVSAKIKPWVEVSLRATANAVVVVVRFVAEFELIYYLSLL